MSDYNAWFSMKQHTPVIAAGSWLSPEGLLAYLLCRRHVSPIAPWVLWLFPMKDKLRNTDWGSRRLGRLEHLRTFQGAGDRCMMHSLDQGELISQKQIY